MANNQARTVLAIVLLLVFVALVLVAVLMVQNISMSGQGLYDTTMSRADAAGATAVHNFRLTQQASP